MKDNTGKEQSFFRKVKDALWSEDEAADRQRLFVYSVVLGISVLTLGCINYLIQHSLMSVKKRYLVGHPDFPEFYTRNTWYTEALGPKILQ